MFQQAVYSEFGQSRLVSYRDPDPCGAPPMRIIVHVDWMPCLQRLWLLREKDLWSAITEIRSPVLEHVQKAV